MGIRYSTAKTILKVFKSEGRIEKKKKRIKKELGNDDSESLISPVGICSEIINKADRFELNNNEGGRSIGSSLPEGFWAARITEHFIETDSESTVSCFKLLNF